MNQVHATSPNTLELEATQDVRPEAAQAVITGGGRLLQLGVQAQSLDDIYSAYFKEVKNDRGHIAAAS